MLSMQVRREGGQYFEPYIVDLDDGCVFVFHDIDITEDGAWYFAQAVTDQAARWLPRTPEMPRGHIVPVLIVREPDLPEVCAIHLDDRAESILYTVDADLMTARAAAVISRKLTERSPHWHRVPDNTKSLHDAV
ncbi:hypothetical protein ACIQNU_03910 [Streptomyces sp. NPDC091292]|uniref:hypothetical protein n=1 Tax=Streptomyces sp. NPDC091292 TaxID=3365991 RepID=UPI003817F728